MVQGAWIVRERHHIDEDRILAAYRNTAWQLTQDSDTDLASTRTKHTPSSTWR